MLCETIEPKNRTHNTKKLVVRGLSVINGAQTIATAAGYVAANPTADVSSARVSITIIKAGPEDDFGKTVTRARNHQNPVALSSFAALDDEQERLRRDLAHLGLRYVYKVGAIDSSRDPAILTIDEAALALAMMQSDPRYAVWAKREPGRLLDVGSDQYKQIFGSGVSAFALANAVRLLRYVHKRAKEEEASASGFERLTYRHGVHALTWVLAKRCSVAVGGARFVQEANLETELSGPFDSLRQMFIEEAESIAGRASADDQSRLKGPLAIFRSQTEAVPLLQRLATRYFNLSHDPVVKHKIGQQDVSQTYPIDLFEYLAQKAPQIEGLG